MGKLSTDAKEAAYRVAGTQIIKTAKSGLLKVMRAKGLNNKHVDSVSNFLDTEVGTAILSTGVGVVMGFLPSFKKDERAQSIAREFRIGGMAVVGNLLADKALSDILPTFTGLLDRLPSLPKESKVSKIRIAKEDDEVELEADSLSYRKYNSQNL